VVAGEHARLLAIDAPEDGQTCQSAGQEWPCGEAAGAALSKLTAGHEVICRAAARDRYCRLRGTCFVGELNLTAEMVRLG
jgi:endonuclease YncB( thermonuclease family)